MATEVVVRPPVLIDSPRGAGVARRVWLGAAALAGSLSVLVVEGLVRPGGLTMIDLAVYRAGGAAVLHGQPLYAAHPEGSLLPFTYPPFAGLLFAPLGLLPWPVAQVLAGLGWLACLIAVVWMALDLAGPRRSAAAGWPRVAVVLAVAAAAVWLEPVRGTLAYGQVNLLLVALVMADLTGRLPRLPRGVLIGVAAGLKLTPGIFVVYLLLTGRRRAAGVAAASFLGTAAVGWLLLPGDSALFWGKLWLDPGHVGGVAYAGNQSLYGAAARLLGGADRAGLVWLLTAAVVGVGGLVVAAATQRAGHELAGIALCGLTGLLVSPISWNHHWVWVLPGTVAAVVTATRRPTSARLVRLGCWLAPLLVAPIWWVPHGDDREYGHHGWQLLAGNAYLLAGLGALALAAVRVVRRGRPASARTLGSSSGAAVSRAWR